jgi:hypothetical protein
MLSIIQHKSYGLFSGPIWSHVWCVWEQYHPYLTFEQHPHVIYHVYRQIESIFALIFAWCSEVYLGRVIFSFMNHSTASQHRSFSRCLEVIIKRREHRSRQIKRERGLRRWMRMGSICQHWQWVECHIQWMLGVGGIKHDMSKHKPTGSTKTLNHMDTTIGGTMDHESLEDGGSRLQLSWAVCSCWSHGSQLHHEAVLTPWPNMSNMS